MISSPCKDCPRKNMPKENCVKDCQLLQAVQDFQIISERSSALNGIDYTAENRYTLLISLTDISVSL